MSLRFAQISIAHTHAHNAFTPQSRKVLNRHDAEMVGIYEPDPTIRRARGDRPEYAGMRWYESYDEILDDPNVSAGYIESWPCECIHWARKALLAGMHIHLDKPPGLSLDDLESLYDVAAKNGM